jgi:hypothetical protein
VNESQKKVVIFAVAVVVLLLLFFGGSAILGPFFGNPIHDSVFNPKPAPPRVVAPPLTEEQRERFRERVRQHRERRGAG